MPTKTTTGYARDSATLHALERVTLQRLLERAASAAWGYQRGTKLGIRYRDIGGKWRSVSTGCNVGEEARAQAVHDDVVAGVRAAVNPASSVPGVLTVRAVASAWLATRETETVADDRGRVEHHILPALGEIPLPSCGLARCVTSSTR
jgi:hypothetical protein